MRTAYKIVAVVAFALTAVSVFQPEQNPYPCPWPIVATCELVHPSSNVLHGNNRMEMLDCGSGTLIAARGEMGLVLTAAHVGGELGAKFHVKWRLAGGQESDGVCVGILHHTGFDTDAALILCKCPEHVQPVELVPFRLEDGPWTNAGFGHGEDDELGKGRLWVSHSDEAQIGTGPAEGIVYTNGLFVGGMSGGGCWNRFGQQVGITNGSTGEFSIVTSGPNVQELVSKFLNGG